MLSFETHEAVMETEFRGSVCLRLHRPFSLIKLSPLAGELGFVWVCNKTIALTPSPAHSCSWLSAFAALQTDEQLFLLISLHVKVVSSS